MYFVYVFINLGFMSIFRVEPFVKTKQYMLYIYIVYSIYSFLMQIIDPLIH